MLFKKVVGYFELLEKTSSSNKMIEILAELFRKTPKDEIDKVAYLALGELGSSYKGQVTGMADKMVLKAIAYAANKDERNVKNIFKKTGDVGLVAEKLVKGKGNLKLSYVFNEIKNRSLLETRCRNFS